MASTLSKEQKDIIQEIGKNLDECIYMYNELLETLDNDQILKSNFEVDRDAMVAALRFGRSATNME